MLSLKPKAVSARLFPLPDVFLLVALCSLTDEVEVPAVKPEMKS